MAHFRDKPKNLKNLEFFTRLSAKTGQTTLKTSKNQVNIYKISLRATSVRHCLNLMTL